MYHVYVTVSGEGRIARFSMDPETGILRFKGNTFASGRPAPLAMTPDRRFAYVARRDDLKLTSYALDSMSGMLTEINTIPVEFDPCYLGTDRTGRWLLSACYLGHKAGVHRIGDDGSLEYPPVEWLTTARGAHCFRTDRSNKFAFVPHIDGHGAPNTIYQFKFDEKTGRITPNESAKVKQPKKTGPRHFTFHPTKDILYFSNEQGCSVSAYRFDPKAGTLSRFQTVTTLPKGWKGDNTCAQIHMTPCGRFLYAPNRGHDSIAQFAVNPDTGKLKALGHVEAEPRPRTFNIDPAGKFLVSAGLDSGRLRTYRIGEDGRLEQTGSTTVGKDPMWVSIVPAG
ncbi:MAG: lactonase family protein [Alphaproteobacteria bacterium]